MRSKIFDAVHLSEPIHTGDYSAANLLRTTEDFEIKGAIFLITRVNHAVNIVMLRRLEVDAALSALYCLN